MEITAKVRFDASKQRVESFGNNRYLVYLSLPEDKDAIDLIIAVLSRYLGVSTRRVAFLSRTPTKDYLFELS